MNRKLATSRSQQWLFSLVLVGLPLSVLSETAIKVVPKTEPISTTDRHRIEEIVVTATPARRSIQETLHSVETFSAEQLSRSTARHFEELLITLPNVEVDPRRGIIIRGTPEQGYGGALPTTLTLIDGGYSPGIRHFWDASQIEILRGGQSGQGSYSGGTFGITYNRAELESSGQLLVNHAMPTNDSEFGIAHGGPLIKDRLAYRVAGYRRHRDGFVTNTFLDDDGWAGRDEKFFRGELRLISEDDSDLSLSILYEDIDRGADELINNLTDPFEYETAINRAGKRSDTRQDIYLRYRKTFGQLKLYNIISTHAWQRFVTSDADGTLQEGGFDVNKASNNSTGNVTYLDYTHGSWSHSMAAYAFLVNTNGKSGFFRYFDLDGGNNPLPEIQTRLAFGFPTDDWWSYGLRVGSRYELPRWTFDAQLLSRGETSFTTRSSSLTRASTTGNSALDGIYDTVLAGVLSPADETEDFSENHLLPSFSVSFHLSDNTTLGLRWERSIRAGWTEVNAYQNRIVPYDSEITDEVDFSIRSLTFEQRLRLNANVFYSKITDQQLRQSQSTAFLDNHTVNAGDSHRLGLEMSSQLYLGDWQIWFSGSLLEAEFDSVNEGVNGIDVGSQVPNTPKWKVHFGVAYDNEGPFFASADVTSRQETTWHVPGRQSILNEGRTLVNARLGWRFPGDVALSVWGRNITNDEYYNERDFGQAHAFLGEPREYGLTLTANW